MRYNMFGVNEVGFVLLYESDYLDVIESHYEDFALLGYDGAYIIDNVVKTVVSSASYICMPKLGKRLVKVNNRKEGYNE